MNIAIVGTGNVGSALGRSLTRAGHKVTVAARDAEKARVIAREVGASAADSPADAARGAEVVILAVPFVALAEVADELRTEVSGKVVVDVTNPLKPDYSGLATEGGPSAAEQLAGYLPAARVVKAFNTVFGSLQANPVLHGEPVDALIAADDDAARRQIGALASSIGLRPIQAGPLDAARQMEALAWLNMRIQMQTGGDWRSAFVLVGVPAAAIAA